MVAASPWRRGGLRNWGLAHYPKPTLRQEVRPRPSGGQQVLLSKKEQPKAAIIVESPTKTRTLARFLGKGYKLLATRGHVRD
ncbi:MAG: hypothetical protein J7M26_09420, partial [Armatimonadetes bacterium]|nr:hypothetical protein [Armatimonadota bacterium]